MESATPSALQPTSGPDVPDEPLDSGPRDIFALEGRPASGLYVVGWFLSLVGAGLLLLLVVTGGGAGRLIFAGGGLLALLLGFAAAAGYQVVARRGRPESAYRGPAPLLVLGFVLALANLVGLALAPFGLVDLDSPAGFLVGVLIPFLAFLIALTLLVVRTGALSWAQMVRLRPGAVVGRVGDYVAGALAGLAIVVPVLVAGGLLASVLQVQPESQLPDLTGGLAGLAIVIGVVFIAPLGEELFYRGFTYTAWRAERGPASALRRSAVLFALLHILNVRATVGEDLGQIGAAVLLQFVIILPAAFLLGFVYERRGLAGSLGTHMGYNGALLALAALALRAGS
ncbi:MAG: CPBP family intramembrane glutamic endopeptidase [Candidatus Limnocylindrales bacterium]